MALHPQNLSIHAKLQAYVALTRLNKPIGLLLLLWPTLWALWIAAGGYPGLKWLLVFTAGVVLMRSAGCAINDYFDRNFDGQVSRTRNRPLARQQIRPIEALLVFAILCLAAAGLWWILPPLARWLAIPAIFLVILYPCMKRYTHLPQLVLGIAFSWGVPMAFAAVTGHVGMLGWAVFFIACLWPIAYDTIYAMVDRDDDVVAGIKSTAILLGEKDTAIIAGLHLLLIGLLIVLGVTLSYHWPYYLGLLLAAGVMIYLQILIKERETSRCFQAFLCSQWVGAAVFLGLVVQ